MESSSFPACFLAIFFTISLLSPQSCNGDLQALSNHHAALFIFGDSIFDAGNNNYISTIADFQADFRPYGETFFKCPTGRFSDGRLIPDFIAEYAGLPLILPYLHPDNKNYFHGVNFASAGAGALVGTFQGLVIDLKTQLSYFNKVEKVLREEMGDAETKALLSRAVYFINIGSNDYLAPFLVNSNLFQSHSPQEYVDWVIGNLSTVIKGIYGKGGRKFAFPSIGSVGCIPVVKATLLQGKDSCLEQITQLLKLHNKQLSKTLLKLGRKLQGFTYSYTDLYTAATKMTNSPEKYGFKEGKVACCGSGAFRGINSCGGRRGIKEYQLCENPNEYIFFDSAHSTEKANQLFAELIWNGDSNISWPLNLKALFHACTGTSLYSLIEPFS